MVASTSAIIPAVEEARRFRTPIKHQSLLTVPVFAPSVAQTSGDEDEQHTEEEEEPEGRFVGSLVSFDVEPVEQSARSARESSSTANRRKRVSQHAAPSVDVDYEPASTVALENLKLASKAMALGMNSVHSNIMLLAEDIPMVRKERCLLLASLAREICLGLSALALPSQPPPPEFSLCVRMRA